MFGDLNYTAPILFILKRRAVLASSHLNTTLIVKALKGQNTTDEPIIEPDRSDLCHANAEHINRNFPLHVASALPPRCCLHEAVAASIECSRVAPFVPYGPVNEWVIQKSLQQGEQGLPTASHRLQYVLACNAKRTLQQKQNSVKTWT